MMRIGIDIGGSHIATAIVDDNGNILKKIEQDIALSSYTNKEEKIIEIILSNIKELDVEVTSIGIGCPGIVKDGIVNDFSNIHMKNFNIVESLKKVFNIPVYVKNDADCAGIGEKLFGNIKEYKNAIFLTIGTGIGGALFIGNKLCEINFEIRSYGYR